MAEATARVYVSNCLTLSPDAAAHSRIRFRPVAGTLSAWSIAAAPLAYRIPRCAHRAARAPRRLQSPAVRATTVPVTPGPRKARRTPARDRFSATCAVLDRPERKQPARRGLGVPRRALACLMIACPPRTACDAPRQAMPAPVAVPTAANGRPALRSIRRDEGNIRS
jgi:hypothetical protein